MTKEEQLIQKIIKDNEELQEEFKVLTLKVAGHNNAVIKYLESGVKK